VTDVDSQIVLAAYTWADASLRRTALVAWIAEGGIAILPLVITVLWFWPGPGLQCRREVVVACALSCLLAVLVVLALDHVADRPRPFVDLGLTPLFPHDADSSFPSDHTLASVAIAGPLAARRPRLGLGLVAWALLIGAARVAAAVHYPSDIAGSALIATVTSVLALLVRPPVPTLTWPGRRSR
jgi:undecaprenyl-diphosphatase